MRTTPSRSKDDLQVLVDAFPAFTLTGPEAGARYFSLSRNSAYAAAQRGDIPTIRIGRKLRVPVVALEKMLDIRPKKTAGT